MSEHETKSRRLRALAIIQARSSRTDQPAAAKIALNLKNAAEARLTLAGKRKGGGFWIMPAGRDIVRQCWQQNIEQARRVRTAQKAA